MARSEDRAKSRRWADLLSERQKSGESVTAFCRRRGLPVHQYYWWQRKLRQHAADEASSASFVPVRVSLASPAIEVVHPGGCVVRVVGGADVQALRSVLAALDRAEA